MRKEFIFLNQQIRFNVDPDPDFKNLHECRFYVLGFYFQLLSKRDYSRNNFEFHLSVNGIKMANSFNATYLEIDLDTGNRHIERKVLSDFFSLKMMDEYILPNLNKS